MCVDIILQQTDRQQKRETLPALNRWWVQSICFFLTGVGVLGRGVSGLGVRAAGASLSFFSAWYILKICARHVKGISKSRNLVNIATSQDSLCCCTTRVHSWRFASGCSNHTFRNGPFARGISAEQTGLRQLVDRDPATTTNNVHISWYVVCRHSSSFILSPHNCCEITCCTMSFL